MLDCYMPVCAPEFKTGTNFFVLCVSLLNGVRWVTHDEFEVFGFGSTESLRTGCRIPLEWLLFSVLQCSGVHPIWYYRKPNSDDCLYAQPRQLYVPFFFSSLFSILQCRNCCRGYLSCPGFKFHLGCRLSYFRLCVGFLSPPGKLRVITLSHTVSA